MKEIKLSDVLAINIKDYEGGLAEGCIAYDPKHNRIAFKETFGEISLYDVNSERSILNLVNKSNSNENTSDNKNLEYYDITTIKFDPSGWYLAVGDDRGNYVLIDIYNNTDKYKHSYSSYRKSEINSIAFSKDGKTIAIVGDCLMMAITIDGEILFIKESLDVGMIKEVKFLDKYIVTLDDMGYIQTMTRHGKTIDVFKPFGNNEIKSMDIIEESMDKIERFNYLALSNNDKVEVYSLYSSDNELDLVCSYCLSADDIVGELDGSPSVDNKNEIKFVKFTPDKKYLLVGMQINKLYDNIKIYVIDIDDFFNPIGSILLDGYDNSMIFNIDIGNNGKSCIAEIGDNNIIVFDIEECINEIKYTKDNKDKMEFLKENGIFIDFNTAKILNSIVSNRIEELLQEHEYESDYDKRLSLTKDIKMLEYILFNKLDVDDFFIE